MCLNPYSTGSNSNENLEFGSYEDDILRLNPYSTGSNSNSCATVIETGDNVLILILLEVTQIL